MAIKGPGEESAGLKWQSEVATAHLPEWLVMLFHSFPKHIKQARIERSNNRIGNNEQGPKPERTSIYVGKFFRKAFKSLTRAIIGNEDTHKIYNRHFVGVILEMAKSEPIRIVTCRILSELFNGEDDLEGAYTTPEQVQLIEKMAKSKGVPEANLEVVNLEELPQHQRLLKKCAEAERDAKGLVTNIEEIFEEPTELNADSDSYDLACHIYHALKDNEQFIAQLKTTLVGFYKYAPDEEVMSRSLYGLTEVAIRLHEAVKTQDAQGGVTRQYVYDEIIKNLLLVGKKGRKGFDSEFKGRGAYRKVTDLLPLAKWIHENGGESFYTVYVEAAGSKEEYEFKQTATRIRLGLIAMLGVVVFGAGNFWFNAAEESRRDRNMAQVTEILDKPESDCPADTQISRMSRQSSENPCSVELFTLADNVGEKLKQRYFSFGSRLVRNDDLKSRVVTWLSKRKTVTYVNDSWEDRQKQLCDLADQFVQDNWLDVVTHHGELGMQPYASFFKHEGVIPALKNAMAKEFDDRGSKERGSQFNSSASEVSMTFHDLEGNEHSMIMQLPPYPELVFAYGRVSDKKFGSYSEERHAYNQRDGRKAAIKFFEMMNYHDSLELSQFKDELSATIGLSEGITLAESDSRLNKATKIDYSSSFGEFAYEVLVARIDETDYLVARKAGTSNPYSTNLVAGELYDFFKRSGRR